MPEATQLISGRAETRWMLLDIRSDLCPPQLGWQSTNAYLHMHTGDSLLSPISNCKRTLPICKGSRCEASPLGEFRPGMSLPWGGRILLLGKDKIVTAVSPVSFNHQREGRRRRPPLSEK